ncbi:MAG: efflux RND transporter periplasmic adaptor subunit [Nitrospinae bacterium]|nr:efflux RND transporter periplasmic adaptor subunit [Nitrospinota bacterium]
MRILVNVARSVFIFCLLIAISLFGESCGKTEKPKEAPKAARATPITTVKAETTTLEIRESSVGTVESRNSPTISAEIAGVIKQIFADNGSRVKAGDLLAKVDDADIKLRVSATASDVARLEVLSQNQDKTVRRLRPLFSQKTIPENQMDDAEAQLKALREQLNSARSQLDSAERELKKTSVLSPFSGKIESRLVSTGDFLSVGKPMFVLSNDDKMQIHLPFPETVAGKIKTGQMVKLSLPSVPGSQYEETISEVRPSINAASKAIDAIINKTNSDGWKSGASVVAAVLVEVHRNAVVVPSASVVLRPAGEVVYVVEGGVVKQRVVTKGERQGDQVEITSGLKNGETVALDGAGFLTDGAAIKVQEPK